VETDDLRLLLRVRQLGSFAAVARSLDLDPSVVSRTVAACEARLGMRLFQRSTRRLTVTDAGEAYLNRVAPALEELQAAADTAKSDRAAPTGNLRLTASVAFAQAVLLPHIRQFQEIYPQISVTLQATDSALDLVDHGIDLAIRLAPAPRGDLISTQLMRTTYRTVAAPHFLQQHRKPAHPQDLADLPCLHYALPDIDPRWQFRLPGAAPFGVAPPGRLSLSGALVLKQAALDGMGVALLADWLVADALVAGELIDLFPGYDCALTSFDTAAWALYPSKSFLPRKTRVMLDFLKQAMTTEGLQKS